MAHGTNLGFEAEGEFAPAFEAGVRRLRAGGARRRSGLAQATSGVRTSGVRFIPQETLERGEAEAEAGLIGDFAINQAQENIADRRARENFERRQSLLTQGFDLQSSLANRLGRGQLKAQAISAGLGGISRLLASRAGA